MNQSDLPPAALLVTRAIATMAVTIVATFVFFAILATRAAMMVCWRTIE